MRSTDPQTTSYRLLTASVAALLLLFAMLVTGAMPAFADSHDTADDDGAEADEEGEHDPSGDADTDVDAEVDADTERSDDTAVSVDEGEGDADDVQRTQPVEETCEPVLAVATPEGVDGEASAIALTAQSLDAEVDGWLRVGWEARTDTNLTAITVRDADGMWTLVDGLESGTLDAVSELTFCGTIDGDADAGDDEPAQDPEDGADAAPDDGADGDTPDGDTDDDADDGADGGTGDGELEPVEEPQTTSDGPDASASDGGTDGGQDTSTQQPTAATSTVTGDGDAEPDDGARDDDEPGVVAVETPDAAPRGDTDGDTAEGTADDAGGDDATSDEDTEVLGVQLTRDDEGGGGLPLGLLSLGAAALLAAAGGVWWYRTGVRTGADR